MQRAAQKDEKPKEVEKATPGADFGAPPSPARRWYAPLIFRVLPLLFLEWTGVFKLISLEFDLEPINCQTSIFMLLSGFYLPCLLRTCDVESKVDVEFPCRAINTSYSKLSCQCLEGHRNIGVSGGRLCPYKQVYEATSIALHADE